MDTKKLNQSADKILSGFDRMAKQLAPRVDKIIDDMEQKSKTFDDGFKQAEKDISRGARTTKHRIAV